MEREADEENKQESNWDEGGEDLCQGSSLFRVTLP